MLSNSRRNQNEYNNILQAVMPSDSDSIFLLGHKEALNSSNQDANHASCYISSASHTTVIAPFSVVNYDNGGMPAIS